VGSSYPTEKRIAPACRSFYQVRFRCEIMSFSALAWASRQLPECAHQKLLLMMLASHYNDQTGLCNPSIKTLALECCMGPTSVKKHLTALEKLGLIVRVSGSRTQSNTYKLSTGVVQEVHYSGPQVGPQTTKGRSPRDQGVGRGATTKQEEETGNINRELITHGSNNSKHVSVTYGEGAVDKLGQAKVQAIGHELGKLLTAGTQPSPRTPFRH